MAARTAPADERAGVPGVLLVATWYPSADDPIAGRFVADQAAALRATGRVSPSVVSFDPANLIGSGPTRTRMARAVADLAGGAIAHRSDVFSERGTRETPGIPVARLPVASGRYPAAGVLWAAVARERALLALADRLVSTRLPGLPRPALVHAHTSYPDGVAAAALARRLGVALVITEHASFIERLLAAPAIRARYVAAARQAIRVVVVSQVLADEIAASMPEIADRLVVVPNAVDIDAFHLPEGGERRADELLFVGYRKESKGLDVLLTAFARIHGQYPDMKLRLVGRAPTEEIDAGWRRRARDLGVGDATHFDPPADRAGVAAAMARATVLVHPSPRETFGIVAVEALAAGLPVVATDSGGVTEILGPRPEPFGAIVPPGDPAALADAIAATLERRAGFDPSAMRAMVEGRFSAPAVAARLLELYDLDRRDAPIGQPPAHEPRAPMASTRRRVVVSFDRERLATIAALPPSCQRDLVVVTSRQAGDPPPALAGFVTADLADRVEAIADAAALGPPGGGLRRIWRIARHPLAVARRRGLLPGLERALRREGTAAVRRGLLLAAAAPSAKGGTSGRPDLICADGVDYLAAAAIVAEGGAELAPGGLRWLADHSLEA